MHTAIHRLACVTRDDVVAIARNSIEAAFLDDAAKAELLAELERVAAS